MALKCSAAFHWFVQFAGWYATCIAVAVLDLVDAAPGRDLPVLENKIVLGPVDRETDVYISRRRVLPCKQTKDKDRRSEKDWTLLQERLGVLSLEWDGQNGGVSLCTTTDGLKSYSAEAEWFSEYTTSITNR